MKNYKFDQNNSGGSFTVNNDLCENVIIEANSENEAIEKAESLGIYFNGVSDGCDCECCGDRWYKPSEMIFPFEYGSNLTFNTLEEYCDYLSRRHSFTDPCVIVHYADDSKKSFTSKSSIT